MHQVQRWTSEGWLTLWEGEEERESRSQWSYYTEYGTKEGVLQHPENGMYRRMHNGERVARRHLFKE